MMVTEIPIDLAPFVQRLVAERRFLSEGDVVAEALRLLQAREELRQQVRLGFNQLDAGLGVPAEEAYARAEQRIEEIEAQGNTDRACPR
jgi:antitoxin ParD1/3/4